MRRNAPLGHWDNGRQVRPPSRRCGHGRRRLGVEQLETRRVLCASHTLDNLIDPATLPSGFAASPVVVSASAAESFAINLASSTGTLTTLGGTIVPTAYAATGIPVLHSLPSAPAAIYLDFDGEGAYAGYDVDGDPSTFNATEAATVTEAWRQISVYFAMFDVDVTTVKPTVPFAWHVSSPDITGGWSYVGVFPNTSPQSFNNAGDARTRVSGISHELGHNFGLSHQSDYDLLGNKTAEYSSGYDSLHGPIMGVDYAQSVHKWFIGHPSNSASSLQDDIAVIAGKIKKYQPTGGDGFRADDYGGTIATARSLQATAGSRSANGIIERMTDVDAFSFVTSAGGAVISVVPTKPSGLDAKLEVYDASGALIAASDGGTNNQEIVLPAGSGTWYVMVSSHGDYGDVGMYDLSVNDLPAGWSSADIGSVGSVGDAGYDPATGTFTVAGSGADVWGTADAFRYAWQTLTGDGSIVARVTQNQSTNAWSKVGVEIRETLTAGSKHVAMVTSSSNGPQMVYRTSTGGTSSSVNGTAAAFTATWVRLVRVGSLITAARSADGVSWTTVGSATVSMASTVFIGLMTCSHDTTKVNEAQFTNVAFTGSINAPAVTNALSAPVGVAVTQGVGTALAVSWQAVTGATGYVVQRSDDGVDFTDAATVASSATSHADTSLTTSMRTFYRVLALDTSGRSVASAVVSAVNRPSAVTNAAVTSLSTSQVVLNWRDKSGDTGYRIEKSTDNVTFTLVTTVGTNVPSTTVSSLTVGTQYWFRITPLSPFGDSVATVITGSTRLQQVGGLAFTTKTSSALSFQWTAVTAATGYRIERSTDGTTFSTLANVGTGVLTYSDTSVSPLGEYYYRVIATNATSEGVNPIAIFAAAPAATPLPAPWSSLDIGSVPGTGAAGYSSGTFTVISSGADIWGTADAFRYTYQTLVGDGSIVARVASVENSGGWAKIGVMIRESVASNSKQAMMVVSPSNSVAMQYRASTGGSSTSIAGPTSLAAPYWVRMVRAGNVFTGSVSPDGTSWTQVGSLTTVTMNSSVLIGLSADSNTNVLLNKSTFTNVTVSNTAPTVVTAAAASPASVTAATTTLTALGADDHGESNLTYTWSASGPASVAFSANGTNAAKSSVATFTKAGSYTLTATIADSSGLSVSSAVAVTVGQTLTAITVTPSTVSLPAGRTQPYAASAIDQFGSPLAVQPAVTWSVTGGGTITSGGLFTAGPVAGTSTIRATSGSIVGTAAATVTPALLPPTVATAAAASPATVTAKTTTLSVLGADDGGEAQLTYTWSASGPASVAFSANGSNAAKSSVATFTKAGSYTLTATIRDADGVAVTSAVVVTVGQKVTAIAVTPGVVSILAGGAQQFAAVATDQFGDPFVVPPAFYWVLGGAGTITQAGLFTAPATAATTTVAAAASFVTGRATVTTTIDQIVSVPAGQSVTDAGGRSGPGAIRKQGSGTLVLAGPNTHAGGLIVEEGEVVIRDLAALGSGGLVVQAGARVTLDVGFGSLAVSSLVLDPAGRLDLGTGRVLVAAGITGSAVRELLLAGRGDGTWNGAGGFVSRMATSESGRTLGYVADSDGVTIAYVAAGDTNLDGVIDVADMANFVSNIDVLGVQAGWNGGDFNYDGVVDQLDLSDFLGTSLFDQGGYQ